MAKRLNYQVGFTVDSTQLLAAVNKATQSLREVSSLQLNTGITEDITNAALAAQNLERCLTNAINVDTGNLDLSKFEASIKNSGLSLEQYAAKLQAIGPIGETAFLNVASAIAKAQLPIARTNQLLDSLWITMKNTMRWQLTSSMLHGFIGAIETAYGYAQDLNESLNNIRIVTNKSTEDMGNFAKSANEAAKALSTTTTDYTNASLIYYQQGLSDEEVLERTKTTIKFANVSRQSAEIASEELTAIWNNFDDGSKSLEYYVDVMTALGATTASSSEEISQGVQKFAATSKTIGLSYEYAASALATVTATTRQSADIVGTAFKTLFARIQDLELGETLDDGTTLGTYSQALYKIGIDIKDVNGELKDMDTILNEMGEKWNTLSSDQQVALAQTVAGVRQYTQLIALMDNWDFFQDNLKTAYNSIGTLSEQANIYAQSWEGARDRVSAAAENIYDSLLNEDFFIEFDNGLADLLDGIANSVDALGGMKGVISLVGLALTSAFGDKMAKGIRDLTYNFSIMTKQAEEAQRKLKTEMGGIALNMVTNSAAMSTSGNITKAQIQAEDIQMQNELNAVARQITEEQQKQLIGYKDIITQIKTMALGYNDIVQEQSNSVNQIEQTILQLNTVARYSNEYRNSLRLAKNELQGMPALISQLGKNSNSFDNLVQGYKQLSQTGSQIAVIGRQLKGLDTSTQTSSILVNKLTKQFSALTGVRLSGNLTKDLNTIELTIQQTDKALEILYNRLLAAGVDSTILESLRESTENVGAAMSNSAHATDIAIEETKKYMLAVYNATIQQKDWASMIVEGSNQLMRIGLMLQSIQTLTTIWDNEDLTTGEKMVQTLTSLGMILPTVISLVQLATAGQISYNTVTVAGTKVKEEDILATYASSTAVKAHTKNKVVETKVIDGNTVAIVKNTTAWYANPIFWIATILVGAIAAYAAYTSAVEKNTKAQIENAKAEAETSQKNAENLKSEREEIVNLYKEYVDLRSRIDESREVKDNLKKKTEELCEALGIEWNALDKLQDKYEEVNREIAEANKNAILESIEDTNKAIEDTRYSIVRQASEYDSSMAKEEEYKRLSYKVDFSAGVSGADEQEIKQLIEDTLINSGYNGIITTGANAGIQIYAENADQVIQMYQLISQAIETAMEELDENIRNESEVFQNAYTWVKDYATEYEKIIQYQEDLTIYAEQLAEAEASITGFDIANINTYEEYLDYETKYIQNLKQSYKEAGILTNEMTEEYFREVARKYLSEYTNLVDETSKANIADAIIEEVGQQNRSTIQQIIDSGKYDLNILGRLDWQFIFDQSDVNSAIDEQYNKVKDQIDAIDFESLLPEINIIIENLLNGKDLTDEQIVKLQALESEYGKLTTIRDRSSAQYIQALHDIREGMEASISRNALSELNNAWNKLIYSVDGYKKAYNQVKDTDINVEIAFDDIDFKKNMQAIMDADYAVQIAIETDIKSDINDIITYANAVQEATGLIQEGFLVAYEDIDALTSVFPGILADYSITADGMIQLNSDIAQSTLELAQSQIKNDKEACRQNILNYQNVMLAKAAAMRTIAENLAKLMNTEITDEETIAEAKANINSAMTDFKSACADEQALISDGLSSSEIDDTNQVMEANENAAGTSANNWADAYNSMQENSSKWAKIAIANANAVAKAMQGAKEGRVVTPEVATGAIFSSYSGGFEEFEYSNAYESRGESGKDWYDYYSEYLAGNQEALQQAYEETIKQAENYEQAAAAASAYLAKIDAAEAVVSNLVNTTGKDSGGSKKTYDEKDKKDLDDIADRYHKINREIQNQKELLDDIDNSIDRSYGLKRLESYDKKLQELSKQQDNYNQKLDDAQKYLVGDTATLKTLFNDSVNLDPETGEILNYQGLLEKMIADYNAAVDKYNNAVSGKTMTEEEHKLYEKELEAAEKLFDKRKEALSQYEDTLDEIQDIKNNLEDILRDIEDTKLDKIEHRLEVVVTIKDMRDEVRSLTKEIVESFGDLLTHGIQSTNLGWDQAIADMGMLKEYQQTYADYKDMLANATDATDIERIIGDLEDLQGQAISTAEALLPWIESIETLLPDAIDDASERFSLFTDQLEHNESILDTIKELYALQGVTYKTTSGFNKLQTVSQEKLDAQLSKSKLQKEWYDNARVALLEAEAALAKVSETDAAYDTLKNNRDALLEEYNQAQEAYLSAAKDAMETAREMFEQEIEKASYDFGKAISNGMGLDLLQDKYDHYIEEEERYLDEVNEAYQVASWYNKLQADIDKTTNSAYKDQLKQLQKEIDIRREGNTLSEYDLEILEAKYKVLQAQMALEDAQNAKNQLRLVRDSQGNWNYQYTSNPDDIAEAEQQLLDAQNEYYNIAKEQVKQVTGDIIDMWQECNEKIKEIYLDETLTVEEREEAIAEIRRYYSQKILDLEEEKNIALNDMTEAGGEIIEKYGNTYDNVLDLMSISAKEFNESFDQALDDMESAMINYGSTIQNIAEETGTSLEDLSQDVDNVSLSTDTCRDSGLEAANAMWEELYAIQDLSEGYAQLAESVYEYIYALRDLAAEMAASAASAAGAGSINAGAGFDINTDYAALMSSMIANGYEVTDPEYLEMLAQRNAKIDYLAEQGYTSDYWGTYGNETYDLFKKYQSGATDEWYEGAQKIYEDVWDDLLKKNLASYDTGGYTGDFQNAKLAFLHEKELVLNEEDTKNILAAVQTIRAFDSNIFSQIEKTLDSAISTGMALMAQRFVVNVDPNMTKDSIQQTVRIEHVEFPNVTSSDEISDAFANIVNDAAQWAQRRKD